MKKTKFKKFAVFMLTATLLTAASVEFAGASETDQEVLEKLTKVNMVDAVLAEYENVSTQLTVFDSDEKEIMYVEAFTGEDHFSYTEKEESSERRIAFGDGEGYMVSSYEGEASGSYLFVDEEKYAENYDYYSYQGASIMYPLENEEVISDELDEAGQRVITTTVTQETGTIIESTYVIDPDSYLIQGGTSIVKDTEGNVWYRMETVRSYDIPESTLLEELKNEITGGDDLRTVTVHSLTDSQSYSVTLKKGMFCYVTVPEETTLYLDEACTEEWNGDVDLNADATYYMQ